MGKTRSLGARIAIIVAIVTAVGLCIWHVVGYHQSQAKMKAEISFLENETKGIITRLDTKNPTEFMKTMAELNLIWEKVDAIEASRTRITSGASWMQRALIRSVPSDWSQQIISNVQGIYRELPTRFVQQSQGLVVTLEATASRGVSGEDMRSAALSFRNNLKSLTSVAADTANVAKSHSIQNISLEDSLSSNRKAREIDKWLDIAFQAEARLIKKSQEAVSIAIQAANATYKIGKDAPSSEIRHALELWQSASRTADNALYDKSFNPGTPPDYALPILRPIFQSSVARAEGISEDISRNLMEVEASYRQAVSDESNIFTGFARKVRRGTRTAGSNLMQLGSAAGKSLDNISRKLASDLQEGMSNTMNAAAMIADKGIQLYQESRKSGVQRFVESRDGQYVLLGGLGLILILAILGGVTNRK